MSLRKSTGSVLKQRSEEYVLISSAFSYGRPTNSSDEVQLAKLYQLGMTSSDESKLLAMRDYMTKLANAISR